MVKIDVPQVGSEQGTGAPSATGGRASPHARVERRADGVWILPTAAADARPMPDAQRPSNAAPRLRIVGPGRRERAWQTREATLADDLDRLRRELETARLVERGSQRLTDRIEADLARERSATADLRQAQARLLVTLGVLQRENEGLRRRIELAEAARPALGAGDAPEPRSLRERLFGSGRRKIDPPRRARR